jgi:hypothetical protein
MDDCDNQGDTANERSGLSWEEKILMNGNVEMEPGR